MASNIEFRKQLEDNDLIQSGHYVLGNGLHTDTYINCALPIMQCMPLYKQLVLELARMVRTNIAQNTGRCMIVGTGKGVFYAHDVACFLARQEGKSDISYQFVFAQKKNGGLHLPYEQSTHIANSEIIFIDDVFVTGRTLGMLQKVAEQFKSQIVQYLTIANRSPHTTLLVGEMNVLIETLTSFSDLSHWENRKSCPLCDKGVPINTTVGGGEAEFHAQGQPSA